MKQIKRIDFSVVKNDFLTAFLGSLGFSQKHISAKTGYTSGPVYVRLGRIGIKLRDYRDGRSPLAKIVTNRVKTEAEARVHQLMANQPKQIGA